MERNNISRRKFIEAAGLGVLSAGAGVPLIGDIGVDIRQPPSIVYRTLGRTGLQMPVVSFGVMNTNSDALIRRAIDVGIRHLDTAYAYRSGNSEIAIGRVLKENGRREEVYIGTKMRFARNTRKKVFINHGRAREPLATVENFNKQLETSLRRLQTDYVDILYLHSCYSPDMVNFEPMMNMLVQAKAAGKARFIGISTHTDIPDVITAAVDAGIYDVVQIAYNYLSKRKKKLREAINHAVERDVGVIAMKVMCGNAMNQENKAKIDHRAALKWVLSDENVCTTIPGMTTMEQLDLNMSVMSDLELSGSERRFIEHASTLKGTLYCHQCRSCVSTCTRQVEIPHLMRAYMYLEGYGNEYQAGRTVAELPLDCGIEICRDCDMCTAVCPDGLEIHDRIRSLMAGGMTGYAERGSAVL